MHRKRKVTAPPPSADHIAAARQHGDQDDRPTEADGRIQAALDEERQQMLSYELKPPNDAEQLTLDAIDQAQTKDATGQLVAIAPGSISQPHRVTWYKPT